MADTGRASPREEPFRSSVGRLSARELEWHVRDDGPLRNEALAELVRRAELCDSSQLLLVALREALDEEQARARTFIRIAGRRNATPAAIDDMVERVFFGLARRAMKLMSRPAPPLPEPSKDHQETIRRG